MLKANANQSPDQNMIFALGWGGHILAALPKDHSPPKNNANKNKKKLVLGIISGTWSCLALKFVIL